MTQGVIARNVTYVLIILFWRLKDGIEAYSTPSDGQEGKLPGCSLFQIR